MRRTPNFASKNPASNKIFGAKFGSALRIVMCPTMSKRKSLNLTGGYVWNTVGDYAMDVVLRALPNFIPSGSVLYLEGTSMSSKLEDFVYGKLASNVEEVHPGTTYPKPKMFHILAIRENLEELATLSESLAEPEICDHLHIYVPGEMIVCGYDFMALPLGFSERFSEQEISRFCETIGCSYEKERMTDT